MRFPPKLSMRELQILPYVTLGMTRSDIAEQLDVGAESVKATTRNLLRKFGYSKIREAMVDLQSFQEIYIQSEQSFFIETAHITYQISQKPKSACCNVRLGLRAVNRGVRSLTQALANAVKIDYAQHNGIKLSADYVFPDCEIFQFDVGKKCKYAEEIDLDYTLHYDVSASDTYSKRFMYWVNEPTAQLNFVLDHDPDVAPKDFCVIGRFAHLSEDVDFDLIRLSHTQVKIHLPKPKYARMYIFQWS